MSTLDGRVFLVDSNGNIVPDEDGDTSNGVYRTTLTQDGTYYADVRANSGAGPNGYYQLDASLGDAQPPVVRSVSRLALPGPDERVYSDTIGSLNPSIYLPLDETSGATLSDASGHGDPGATLTGAATYGVESVFGTSSQGIGIGGDAHIEIADSDRVEGVRGVSFSFWMQVDSFANTWTPLVFKGTTSSNQRSYALWLQSNGNLNLNSSDSSGNQVVDTGALLGRGSWNHIAVSIDRDAGVMQLWVNGVRRANQTIRTGDIRQNDNPLLLGHTLENSSAYSKFDGAIDQFALWTEAVDSTQLLAPYFESQWLGEARSTGQLLGSFEVGVSERLLGGSVNYQGPNYRTFGGNTYFATNTRRTLSDATSYAASFGGNLVSITSQEEQDFINEWLTSQNTDYWVGLRDANGDDTFGWDTGEELSYTHWWPGYPTGSADGVQFRPGNNEGRWFNTNANSSYGTIVELVGDADGDGDGLPDVLDRRPDDALNGWELRSSGGGWRFRYRRRSDL